MRNSQPMPIQYVKGVGPAKKKLFERLGIQTVEDLLYFFPRRYEDRRHLTPIAQAQINTWQTISGTIVSKQARKTWHTRKHVLEIVLDDGSGRMVCLWFNQAYLERYFYPGKKLICYGQLERYHNRIQMVAPEYEIMDSSQESFNLKRIVPVYSLTRGMTQRFLRKIIHSALERYIDQIQDPLPVPLRNKYRLVNLQRSLWQMHFPKEMTDQQQAFRRISFEEFFFFQISIILRRWSIKQKKGVAHRITEAWKIQFSQAFAFSLTNAQKKVIREIGWDMERPTPMLRLLQGDVGSGKTVVALFGCVMAIQNGYQACIMAPTAILARQHYENIQHMLSGGPWRDIRLALLVNDQKKAEKDQWQARIKTGDIQLIIGTHALISEGVQFKNLSFVVIDEQHKFGVQQRALLSRKGNNPDVLVMTATPIPRSLCISLYGDLDVSLLDEMPPGRGKVTTRLYAMEQEQEVYDLVRQKIQSGSQAYIVYPLIEESDQLPLKAARVMQRRLQETVFKEYRVGLIHGQMKKEASRAVMRQFKNGEIDVLIATTVLEVGVDVARANVMVVEQAERFGLAQLHQLRGRIGRGQQDGLCLLLADPRTPEAKARLQAICATTNGFKIAQHDLAIRGPGHFFGRHQHGFSELKVANPATQMDILQLARQEALNLIEQDPPLQQPQHRHIKTVIQQRYPTYLSLVEAG